LGIFILINLVTLCEKPNQKTRIKAKYDRSKFLPLIPNSIKIDHPATRKSGLIMSQIIPQLKLSFFPRNDLPGFINKKNNIVISSIVLKKEFFLLIIVS